MRAEEQRHQRCLYRRHVTHEEPTYRINVRNSLLVLSDLRKAPSMADVTVVAPGFWTPRMVMHM